VPAPDPRPCSQVIDSLWNQTTHYRRAYLRLINEEHREVDLGFLEHRLMIDALQRRDAAGAAELVRMHLRRSRSRITEHADALSKGGTPDADRKRSV
jgi:DNA-binding GntR family transcriptional regulator